MPRGGDGAACSAASPDEGRWVPRLIALARQHAEEAARHAPRVALGGYHGGAAP
jgi:hypothetical protein